MPNWRKGVQGPQRKYVKKRKVRAKKAVDKKQNKRIRALESKVRAEQGWLDPYYTETTVNRVPQEIQRGRHDSSVASQFFSMASDTDLADNDHTRIGRSIKAQRVKGTVTFYGRGSAAGFPPDDGDKSGKNSIRLLGVIYKTAEDYALGLGQVLSSSVAIDSHPARVIDSFYKKQSQSNWKIWMDKKLFVPYTTAGTKVKINYKIPKDCQKMVYESNSVGSPLTNIMVLYCMSGIRDNTTNQTTAQATYRLTYEK